MKIAILFSSFGPYHLSRIRALQHFVSAKGCRLTAMRFAKESEMYRWNEPKIDGVDVATLTPGKDAEHCPLLALFVNFFTRIRQSKIDVALLPSYYPVRNLLCLIACKILRVKCILMSESWDETASPNLIKRFLKRNILSLFQGAIVGGTPHRNFYISQGMKQQKVFTGYDAVDNDYFYKESDRARRNALMERQRLNLPNFYFLSLGRMVAKKNLKILIEAYAVLSRQKRDLSHQLVFVGSGVLENDLKILCQKLHLEIIDHSSKPKELSCSNLPAVHFYGFRQIEENPVFYALASAFILPSSYEEWGLVINEAMACSLPVIVSRKVGCANDLVRYGYNGFTFNPTDRYELADHLNKIVTEPDLVRQMGKNSQKMIKKWSCENFAKNAWEAISHAYH
jgi:1,2-diacylglycerol 3-alpha-glucosyltransferase